MKRGFEQVKEEFLKNTYGEGENVVLPLRGSKTSAGYDLYATKDLEIKPQDKAFFWTDIKSKMPEGEVLLAVVRSSMGVKHDLMLSNTVAVIDSDYYSNEGNDGNIGISIRNLKPASSLQDFSYVVIDGTQFKIPLLEDLTEQNTVHIAKGERVAQLIFVKYAEAENCNSEDSRVGGFGSTSK